MSLTEDELDIELGRLVPASSDIFDRSVRFNEVDFVNELFPTVESLEGLPRYMADLREKLRLVDIELKSTLSTQSEFSEKYETELSLSKEALGELVTHIGDLRSKAATANDAIQLAAGNLLRLDRAKKNITFTISTLKRLVMLVQACEQLTELAYAREYSKTACLVLAIKELETCFVPLRDISRIKDLLKHKDRIFQDLNNQIMEDYENAFLLEVGVSSDGVVGAGETGEALKGVGFKEEIINIYCMQILSEYRQPSSPFVPPMGRYSGLQSIEHRLVWFRGVLKTHLERVSRLFPSDWSSTLVVCVQFFHMTRQHLVEVLSSARAGEIDPEVLMKALAISIDFEKELQRKIQGSFEVSGLLSKCFYPFLIVWLKSEENILMNMCKSGLEFNQKIMEIAEDEENENTGGKSIILACVVDIFTHMKSLSQKCRAFSDSQENIAQLIDILRKCFHFLASPVLESNIVISPTTVVGSCDHCMKTIPLLLENLKKCMTVVSLGDSTFESEIARFGRIGVDAINHMSNSILNSPNVARENLEFFSQTLSKRNFLKVKDQTAITAIQKVSEIFSLGTCSLKSIQFWAKVLEILREISSDSKIDEFFLIFSSVSKGGDRNSLFEYVKNMNKFSLSEAELIDLVDRAMAYSILVEDEPSSSSSGIPPAPPQEQPHYEPPQVFPSSSSLPSFQKTFRSIGESLKANTKFFLPK